MRKNRRYYISNPARPLDIVNFSTTAHNSETFRQPILFGFCCYLPGIEFETIYHLQFAKLEEFANEKTCFCWKRIICIVWYLNGDLRWILTICSCKEGFCRPNRILIWRSCCGFHFSRSVSKQEQWSYILLYMHIGGHNWFVSCKLREFERRK